MLLLTHLSRDAEARANPFLAGGLIYPDIFIALPRIRYETTHFVPRTPIKTLRHVKETCGEQAADFANGILKHVRDDWRLPFLAYACQKWALPIASQVWSALSIPALATKQSEVEQVLLTDVVAGSLEFALALLPLPPLASLERLDNTFHDRQVIRFIGELWSLNVETVTQANTDYWKQLLPILQNGTAELVETEMRLFWPKLAASHLYRAGLLNLREAVVAIKQIQHSIDGLLLAMSDTDRIFNQWPLLESTLELPRPAHHDSDGIGAPPATIWRSHL